MSTTWVVANESACFENPRLSLMWHASSVARGWLKNEVAGTCVL